MAIRSIPTTYAGTRFRSKLEASWAAAFDEQGIIWAYEPEGWAFGPGLCYLPDFYLPQLRTIVEVKGVLDERSAAKIEALHGEARINRVMVVLAVAPVGMWAEVKADRMEWRRGFDVCPDCGAHQFFDDHQCRICQVKRVDESRPWALPYSDADRAKVWRWWAREMVRVGRMEDAAEFMAEAIRIQGAA